MLHKGLPFPTQRYSSAHPLLVYSHAPLLFFAIVELLPYPLPPYPPSSLPFPPPTCFCMTNIYTWRGDVIE